MTQVVSPGSQARHRAAVLGSPISHSLSPVLHSAGYEAAGLQGWEYSRILCEAEDLPRVVGECDASFRGFSVTMPCKFAALEFADDVTDRAREVGSANTLVRLDDGRWRADNTDAEGAVVAIQELLGETEPKRAVLVGAGGTARAVMWALRTLGAREVVVVNRTDRSGEFADLARGMDVRFVGVDEDVTDITCAADIVVSTVPAHTIGERAVGLAHAPVFDVIYDPWPTYLATRAAANGYPTVGGLSMLAGQSYSQFEQFTGVEAPREAMRDALLRARQHQQK
ncbi:shikimate dehydrogenase [Corynebacterium sp. Marseille-P4321]|uniref:shikimate dehydrogenase n=1 Tax=Corynebacterium sp. Marseille-P4321 TaxID=2736603 RepID=UPI0008934B8C|nr:shikimate dehydrogenase [Corynebacterium sp. Marseille-P4321]OEY23905.1 shikimate dehydrogenase [Corynebacterium sp. BCW_4722]